MHTAIRLSLLASFFLTGLCQLQAQSDTLVVETFDFNDPSPIGFSAPYRGTFQFPDTSESFSKILMYYTLKCDPATAQDGFDCGEWDYLTYTYVYDSTAWFDSTYRTHPNFRIGGVTPDSVPISWQPQYEYTRDWQKYPVITDTNSVSITTLGTGTQSSTFPFATSQPRSRSQYLWQASELTSAGLSAGPISGLQLDLSLLPEAMSYLQIRVKHSTLDSLDANQVEQAGFETVYRQHTGFFQVLGWQSFPFFQPFVWDGVSNVVVEFSYSNAQGGSDGAINATTTAFPSGVHTAGEEHYLSFQGPDMVEVDASVFANRLSDQVTVSVWQYGDPDFQPQSDYLFEARDSSDRRVLNVHLPWNNGQVYWDAGNSGTGTYDRINKSATASEYAGQWNHWAFTKDANTGEMKMYLNGQLWHSGTGLTRSMDGIARFVIGSNRNGGGNYDGYLDEFRVWDTVLSETAIQQWMYRSVDPSHPQYSHLLAYFPFDEGDGTTLNGQSPNQVAAELAGFPDWRQPLPQDLFRDWNATHLRPNVRFDQSDYVFTLDSVRVLDSVAVMPSSIVIYGNDAQGSLVFEGSANHPTQPTDTLMAWEGGGYSYVYDWLTGEKVDSVVQTADSTLFRNDIEYYSNIVRYELGRYITPYGINLDLGPEGTTWVFDITDYAPLLHNWVRLQAGNNQELLDLRFVMIKGTPPRTVRKIENLWSGSFSYASLLDDRSGQAVFKRLDPGASMFQVKTRTTGHGFGGPSNCAEFCQKFHYLNLNDQQAFSWFLWNECADNFVYPQGGTWLYDRAGWCPGAKVSTYEHELTPLVSPGDTVKLDYDIQDAIASGPEGNYVLQGQLFSYGPPNYGREVEITEILAPNNKDEFSRINPICDHPTIAVRNLGSTPVTSLKFEYGTQSGLFPCYYFWEGNLDFLESQEIDLPRFNWTNTSQTDPQFYVEILEVNGTAGDENPDNNFQQVPFTLVPNYLPGAILEIKTNSAANENSYRFYDKDGNIVKIRLGMANNTFYRDTLNLPDGCYTFQLFDTGQDGISWWANNDGIGTVRLVRPNGGFYKVFEPDYGMGIVHQFTIGYSQGAEAPDVQCDASVSLEDDLRENQVRVYPNPNRGSFSVEVSFGQLRDLQISVQNALGVQLYQQNHRSVQSQVYALDLDLSAGLYFVKVQTEEGSFSQPFVVK
jgi:hypothetical protein